MRIGRFAIAWRRGAVDLVFVVAGVLALGARLPFFAALSSAPHVSEPLLNSIRMFKFGAAHVLSGELPLWNPYVSMGYPFLALGLGGVFYPPTWAYSFEDVTTVARVDLFGHVILGAVFAYFLGRDHFKHRASMIFVAIAFLCMPAAGSLFGDQHITVAHAAAYFPLVLLAGRRVLATGRPAWGLALAVGVAAQVLTGAFQFLAFECVGLCLFVIGDLVRRYLAEWEPARRVAGKGFLTVMFALVGLALAGAQLVPTAELLSENLGSPGSAAKLVDSGFVSMFPFNYLRITNELTDPNYLYVGGPFLFALAVFGFFRTGNREKWVYVFVALQGLVYIRGEYAWLHRLFFPLSIFDASQSPAQVAALGSMLVTLMAGYGVDAMLERPAAGESQLRRSWPLLVALTTILFVSIALLSPLYERPVWIVAGLAAAGVLAITIQELMPSSATLVWLACCLILDTTRGLEPRPLHRAPSNVYRAGGEFDTIAKAHQGRDRLALVADAGGTSHLEAGTPVKERTFPLYSGRGFRYAGQLRAYPLQAPVTASELPLLQADLRYFALLNIGFIVTPRPGSPFLDSVSAPGMPYLKQELGDAVVYKNTVAMPMAFIVHRATLRNRSVPFFRTLTPGDFDASKTVLVDGAIDDTTFREPAGSEGIRVERYTETEVEFALSVAAPGVLVFSDAYYPGWRTIVNDTTPRAVFPADETLRGVLVEPGDAKVVFRFEPPSVRWGLIITEVAAAVWILTALSLIIFHRVYRRPIEAVPQDAQGAPSP